MNASLKEYVRFGTSSWAFEGWIGNVYHLKYPEGKFKRDCLKEYWQDVRFSTVGMDLFFYNPPAEALLKHYAGQFPDDGNLKACCKVWQELTIYRFPDISTWKDRKGTLNPDFLNADIFAERVLEVHKKVFMKHTGPFIFEFQYMKKDDLSVEEFAEKLDLFFSQLPREFRYSVEIRNKNFLKPVYFDTLRKHNVAHLFNYWSYMPPIREQLDHDAVTSDFIVSRILTPPGMDYQKTVRKFEPYNRIVEKQPDMREDVMKLIEISIKERKYAYLLINNRIEGCAPDTIKELIKMAKERFK